jgi:hypothetical protein
MEEPSYQANDTETRSDRWFQHQNMFNVIQYDESSFCHDAQRTIGTNETV